MRGLKIFVSSCTDHEGIYLGRYNHIYTPGHTLNSGCSQTSRGAKLREKS